MPPDSGSWPSAHEEGRMQGFVASLLRHEGALVEPIEPEGLEVLAPPPIQQALGLPEFSRLGFGATLPPSAQRVGIEGDWLDRFARLLGPAGRWSRRVLSYRARAPNDAERLLERELVLDNATFRLQGVAPAWTRYLVLDFRASAVSDEKRDFMLRLGVNLATGAMPDAALPAMLEAPDEGDAEVGELPPLWDQAQVRDLVSRGLQPRLDAALAPFVKALRRRLERDQDRLHQYHNDLHREALTRRQALPEGDARRERESQRAEAIAREYRSKLDDLSRQYATRVTVEWVQTLELVMPVHRFSVQVRRRKADRLIAMDWNPLTRRLESPGCDATASAERPRLVCDDALHLVVPAALGPCTGCGKAYCRACHRDRCPKCGVATACSIDGQSL